MLLTPRFIFHWTSPKLLAAILEEGLLAERCQCGMDDAIYCSDAPQNYRGHRIDVNGLSACVVIDTRRVTANVESSSLDEEDMMREIGVMGDVPPAAIVGAWIEEIR